jgi:hypothetical protein
VNSCNSQTLPAPKPGAVFSLVLDRHRWHKMLAELINRCIGSVNGPRRPDQSLAVAAPTRVSRRLAAAISTKANAHFIAVHSLLLVTFGQLTIFIDYLISFSLMFCSYGLLSRR